MQARLPVHSSPLLPPFGPGASKLAPRRTGKSCEGWRPPSSSGECSAHADTSRGTHPALTRGEGSRRHPRQLYGEVGREPALACRSPRGDADGQGPAQMPGAESRSNTWWRRDVALASCCRSPCRRIGTVEMTRLRRSKSDCASPGPARRCIRSSSIDGRCLERGVLVHSWPSTGAWSRDDT